MNGDDERDLERGGDYMLAAEYVLGVLDAAQRQEATRRIEADQAFARLVDAWEVRLSGLAEDYEPEAAPERVKAGIDLRLFGGRTDAHRSGRAGLWSSLAFWRGISAAAVAALLLIAAMSYFPGLGTAPPAPRLMAALAADGSPVRYVALYDAAGAKVAMSHIAGERAADRDFELWLIEGNNAPMSVGVIPQGGSVSMALDDAMRGIMASGAVLAISEEPRGGSPTGQPTGPVVAAGDLRAI